jgi:hypothetical protein
MLLFVWRKADNKMALCVFEDKLLQEEIEGRGLFVCWQTPLAQHCIANTNVKTLPLKAARQARLDGLPKPKHMFNSSSIQQGRLCDCHTFLENR